FSTMPTPESPGGRYGAHWWLKLNPEIGGDDPAAGSIAPDAFFAIGHEGQTLTIIPSRRLVVVRLGASIYIDAWNHAQFIAELQDALYCGRWALVKDSHGITKSRKLFETACSRRSASEGL